MNNAINSNDTKEESFFDFPEFDAFLFWKHFNVSARRIKELADCILHNKRKQPVLQDSLSKISAELDSVKALLLDTYQLILDTDPNHNLFVDANDTNIAALYFWSMDHQEDIEIVNNTLVVGIDIKDTIKDKDLEQEVESVFNSMHALYSLVYNVIMMPVTLLKYFDAFLEDFRKSQYGEHVLSSWRKDFDVSREELLLRLKEIKYFRPWVEKSKLLYEGKIEKRDLFVDKSILGIRHNPERNKTNSWLSIFSIMCILKEYDLNQEIVHKLKPFFYNNEDESRNFIKYIRGLEPLMITAYVKQLVSDNKIPKALKGKKLYDVLYDNNLYGLSYQNWSSQV